MLVLITTPLIYVMLAMMIVSCLLGRERTEESIAVQVQILPVDCRPKKKGPKKLKPIKKKKVMSNKSNNQMKIVLNRLENLEGALMEKDVEIRKLEKKVQSLQRKSNIPQPKAIKSKSPQNIEMRPKKPPVNRTKSLEPKLVIG